MHHQHYVKARYNTSGFVPHTTQLTRKSQQEQQDHKTLMPPSRSVDMTHSVHFM